TRRDSFGKLFQCAWSATIRRKVAGSEPGDWQRCSAGLRLLATRVRSRRKCFGQDHSDSGYITSDHRDHTTGVLRHESGRVGRHLSPVDTWQSRGRHERTNPGLGDGNRAVEAGSDAEAGARIPKTGAATDSQGVAGT